MTIMQKEDHLHISGKVSASELHLDELWTLLDCSVADGYSLLFTKGL